MKLDPLFKVTDSNLIKLSDNSKIDLSKITSLQENNLTMPETQFCTIQIKWSTVELGEEVYNEEFLAALRDFLKQLDENNKFAVIIPVADKPVETAEQAEAFTAAFNHTARRIKDCVSVAGMELPEEFIKDGVNPDGKAAAFMETLAIKHAQFVYFVRKSVAEKLNIQENLQKKSIVMY